MKGLFLLFALSLSSFALEAQNFGIFGQTFQIEEESLKDILQQKASRLSHGDIEKSYKSLEKKIREEGLFKPVCIKEAQEYYSWDYDPSIILEEDIFDADGNLLHSKGKKVNPLDHVVLDSGLLFFDGNNPKHVQWAESQAGEYKWILVSGNPLKLQEDKKRPVFFDQKGFYVSKLHIQKVPCRVSQSGETLLVEEIPVLKEK